MNDLAPVFHSANSLRCVNHMPVLGCLFRIAVLWFEDGRGAASHALMFSTVVLKTRISIY